MHFERLLSSHGNGRWTASPFVSHSVETQATNNYLERRSEWLLFLDWKIPLYNVETVVEL